MAIAGVAIVGASALAITPVTPVEAPVPQLSPAVQLTAAAGVLGPDQSTLDLPHAAFYNLLPLLKSTGLVTISPTAQQLVDFSTSSLSGVLLGLAGPIAGPSVLLIANLQSIASSVAAGNVGGALNTLVGTPAALVNAALFGGVHLDLSSLVASAGPGLGLKFPDGVKVGVVFGGLLSPAGSVFNALDFDFSVELGFLPVGTIGLAGGTGPGAISSLAAAVGNAVSAIAEIPQSVVNTLTAGLPNLAAHNAAATTGVAAPAQLEDNPTRVGVKAAPDAIPRISGKHRASVGAQAQVSAAASDAAPTAKGRPPRPDPRDGQASKAAKHAAA